MPKITPTLATRIAAAADGVRVVRAKQVQLDKELIQALDDLALAEAEVLRKAPGWEGIELSGLIEEGKNPYCEPPKATAKEAAMEHMALEKKPGEPEPEPDPTPEPEDDEPKAKVKKGAKP